MLAALLLDFDGLLYDTESSVYDSWERLYAAHGAQMSLQRWVSEAIGRAPTDQSFDPLVELERITGERFDRAAVLARRDAERRALLPHELMPGADALLAAARSRGLETAIVTSNGRVNVDGHLARAGCEHRFDAIVCADGDAARSKPRPTLYLEALALLGLSADQAIAFEDSPNGIAAAQAAGLYCIAVPNRLTRVAPGVRAADRMLGSLEDVDLDELAARSRPSSLGRRLRRQSDRLKRSGRSPLYATLVAAAADDAERGGIVARLFSGVELPPGSVPALRLMAAVHELALTARDPELTALFGAVRADDRGDPWTVVRAALEDHAEFIEPRLQRSVQTNEPGRAAVLYPLLLSLAARDGRPIRLLEIGSSAGLNLICDRYRYDAGGLVLGDPGSPVRFTDPWQPGPAIDLAAAAAGLAIAHREGCDPSPLDPSDPDDQRRIRSYIWPDERDRLARVDAALTVAAPRPPMVVRARAIEWLPDALQRRRAGELTVVWHSVVRQYVDAGEWRAIDSVLMQAIAESAERPVVWVAMEPPRADEPGGAFKVTLRDRATGPATLVARCGDHGPPVVWAADGSLIAAAGDRRAD